MIIKKNFKETVLRKLQDKKADTNPVVKNEEEELSTEITRKCKVIIEGQVKAIESLIISTEQQIKPLEVAHEKALFPTEIPTVDMYYINGIKNTKDALDEKKRLLASQTASLDYYKKLLEQF